MRINYIRKVIKKIKKCFSGHFTTGKQGYYRGCWKSNTELCGEKSQAKQEKERQREKSP